jgi:4-hydroxy-3-polyprenylbenzoate decarboxylase
MEANLREFVAALERAGELVRITAPVDPVLEIAAITDRVSKSAAPRSPSDAATKFDPNHCGSGGPALLFENVVGSEWPVLINAFGSYRRMEMALGCAGAGGFESIAARIAELVKPEPPRSLGEAMAMLKKFAPLRRIPPKPVHTGACQEVVLTSDAIDLTRLPLIRCWPTDGDYASLGYPADVNEGIEGLGSGDEWNARFRGRYITLAGVHTIHADDAGQAKPRSHNVGMYRVQLLGRRHMAMHWHVHHDGASHWRSWKARGERMPVAVALGGPAVLPYAATAPLPPGINELLMAGFLQGRGVRMTMGKTVPIRVPADAEIVIEGYVSSEAGPIGFDPRVDGELGPGAVFEGPFGDHTGFYSMPDRYPVFEVTAITHRRDPIYPTTIVGMPPQEDYYLGKATERMFLPLLRTLVPDIADYDLPQFGAFHNCALVQIDKQYPLQARRVMHAIWGAGQMAWTKSIFVVDGDVDVHDADAVLAACARHCDPARDIELVKGPLDILDHAAPWIGAGTKIGFDCTPKRSGEEVKGGAITAPRLFSAEDRARWVADALTVNGVAHAWAPDELAGWLFVRTETAGRAIAMGLARTGEGPPFTVVVGADVEPSSTDRALFHWCAQSDPGRDAIRAGRSMVFDATPKSGVTQIAGLPVRAWPPPMTVDDATNALVDHRWGEYGLG